MPARDTRIKSSTRNMNSGDLPEEARPIFEYEHYLGLEEHEIRLVVLHPLRDSNPRITCNLIRAHCGNKNEAPKYNALSYTWSYELQGVGVQERVILLNGCRLMIGRNLWWALYNLCPREGTSNLWVDALCINQGNLVERNHQVKMMGEIYSEAQEVFLWLGNEDDHSEVALKLITNLAQSSFSSALSIWKLSRQLRRHWSTVQYSLERFLSRSYWRRLWIVQEIVLAKTLTIYCGSTRVPWKHIAIACDKFRKPAPFLEASLIPIISTLQQSMPAFLERSRRDLMGGRSLLTLLHICQDSQASDQRDMVYGLLGISNDSSFLSVDYSSSPYELWLNLIELQIWPPPLTPPSATFSGDVTRSMYFSQLLWDVLKLPGSVSALNSIPKGIIHLKGIWRDTVIQIGPSGSEMKAARHHAWNRRERDQPVSRWDQDLIMCGNVPWDMEVLQGIDLFLSHKQALHIFDDKFKNVNAAEISIDAFDESFSGQSPPLRRKRNDSAMTTRHAHASLMVRTATESEEAQYAQLGTTLFKPHYDFCRFIITDSGRIGMTSPEAQPGDLVCQFRGCDIALLLRQDLGGGIIDTTHERQRVEPAALQFKVVARVMLFRDRHETARCREGSNRAFRHAVPDDDDSASGFVDVECSLSTRTLASLVMYLQPVASTIADQH